MMQLFGTVPNVMQVAADRAAPPERTRTFSWSDPAILEAASREMSGLDLLRAVTEGKLPAPPIAELVGATLVSVQEGRVTFAMQPAEWMYNPIGSVHGGMAATLLDSCMGCAVASLLPAGVAYTTADLQVRYVRAMSASTGRVLATGNVIHPGRRLMTVESRLTTQDDEKLLAHGTCACIVLR